MTSQWRPPPLECPILIEGRRLFKDKQYAEAATAFRAGLDRRQLANAPAAAAVVEDGYEYIWTAEEVSISTRLFLLKALSASGETNNVHADEALGEAKMLLSDITGIAESQCRPGLIIIVCQTISRLAHVNVVSGESSVDDGGPIVSMGVAACRVILDNAKYGTRKQRRLFYELESNLYEQTGNLQAALASTEALLQEFPENQAQQRRWRDLGVRLGLINEAAERIAAGAEEERREQRRGQRKRNRKRQKFKQSAQLGERLAELGPVVQSTLNRSAKYGFFEDSSKANMDPSRIIDWSTIPPEITPDHSIRKKKGVRVRRKQLQLEALYVLLRDMMDAVVAKSAGECNRPLHIIDFGSGSGNSCLVFAWLLRHIPCRFTLVDSNAHSVMLGKKRTSEAGLNSSVSWACRDVADFNENFDIGLATHLCGGGTDLAMMKCIDEKAAFLATPCCLGKIQFAINTERDNISGSGKNPCALQYPRSEWLRDRLSVDEYAAMTRLGDCTAVEGAETGTELRMKGKALLDADRLKLAREAGYETAFGQLGSKAECGPKRDVLCGLCIQ